MQAKAENALEADKLAKRNARPPKTAVHSGSLPYNVKWVRRGKAAESVEEAKQLHAGISLLVFAARERESFERENKCD